MNVYPNSLLEEKIRVDRVLRAEEALRRVSGWTLIMAKNTNQRRPIEYIDAAIQELTALRRDLRPNQGALAMTNPADMERYLMHAASSATQALACLVKPASAPPASKTE